MTGWYWGWGEGGEAVRERVQEEHVTLPELSTEIEGTFTLHVEGEPFSPNVYCKKLKIRCMEVGVANFFIGKKNKPSLGIWMKNVLLCTPLSVYVCMHVCIYLPYTPATKDTQRFHGLI